MFKILPQTTAVIEKGIIDGSHLGAQVYLSKSGKTLCNLAFGESRPGVAMTADTINQWFSSGKPFTALAIAQCRQKKLLDWDDPVVRYIPEFGVRNKGPITIRHLLTHTGGFRIAIGLKIEDPFDVAVQKVCNAPLEPGWQIGHMAGYHPVTSWYILAELVRRVDGRMIDRYVREMILQPLGMSDSWMAIPSEKFHDYGERNGLVFNTSGRTSDVEKNNLESIAANVRPASGMRGPFHELGKFYEMLLAEKDSDLIKPLITRQRVGMFDRSFKHVIDWGLGFIINTDPAMPYGYGPYAGRDTFGHSGSQSSCAFCDPQHELVVAWFCNGMNGDALHDQRQQAINRAIYEDLSANGTLPESSE